MHKINMMLVAGGMLAMTSCSDFTDYNEVPSDVNPAAEKTLWENISTNEQLSDFASVLQRLGYDKVLDAAHTYTVWAPVNGSFDVEALKNTADEKVIKEFLMNHIADYAHRETDVNDTVIYMLNEKLMKFTNKNSGSLSFDDAQVLPNATNQAVYNYPCSNGLLYTISTPSVFRYNGYEYLSELYGTADSLLEYFKRYETITLDLNASVKGEIKDGVQHYDDSVVIVSNVMTRDLLRSEIENEDSLYTILIPTNEAWTKAYERIASYYNYIPSIAYQDLSHEELGNKKGTDGTIMNAKLGSKTITIAAPPVNAPIQETGAYWNDSITRRFIVNDLIFSEHDAYNVKLASGEAFAENDTLHSTTRSYLTNLSKLESVTKKIERLSNGHARIINEYPFLPEETYAPIIRTINVGRIVTGEGSDYSVVRVNKQFLDPAICVLEEDQEELIYLKTDLPENSTYAPELDIYLPSVLSTTYDVSVVIVPACLENSELAEEERKPYSLYFDLNYTDASNTQITGRFDGEKLCVGTANVKKVEPFSVAQHKVDTVKLGRITFPICYAMTEAMPNLKVIHSVKNFFTTNKKKYEQILRIANVILEPVEKEEE